MANFLCHRMFNPSIHKSLLLKKNMPTAIPKSNEKQLYLALQASETFLPSFISQTYTCHSYTFYITFNRNIWNMFRFFSWQNLNCLESSCWINSDIKNFGWQIWLFLVDVFIKYSKNILTVQVIFNSIFWIFLLWDYCFFFYSYLK